MINNKQKANSQKANFDTFDGHAFVLRELLSGEYIAGYDPDEHAPGIPFPTGFVQSTDDRAMALQFATLEDAVAFILQPSKITPLRPDGKPNRPLTRLSLVIEWVPSYRGRQS